MRRCGRPRSRRAATNSSRPCRTGSRPWSAIVASSSGGQRQRIALARAFLKDAPILLLDEATSALDHESEEMIREALARLMRGRTVIAIAHRLATLRSFDRLILMEDGVILADGPPERLIKAERRLAEIERLEEARIRRAA